MDIEGRLYLLTILSRTVHDGPFDFRECASSYGNKERTRFSFCFEIWRDVVDYIKISTDLAHRLRLDSFASQHA